MMTLRVTAAVAVLIAACGCASTRAVPRPFPTPEQPESPEAPAEPSRAPAVPDTPPASTFVDGSAITATALDLRGAPYQAGGTDPTGFDCSGFVQYVFARHGINVPREVKDLYRAGRGVDETRIAPGDLLFFTTVAPGPSHVGIAIGADEFIHAPSTHGVVRVERLSSEYWGLRFLGARRVADPVRTAALRRP
jgi:cell wall-associated NlpC family hydrolase